MKKPIICISHICSIYTNFLTEIMASIMSASNSVATMVQMCESNPVMLQLLIAIGRGVYAESSNKLSDDEILKKMHADSIQSANSSIIGQWIDQKKSACTVQDQSTKFNVDYFDNIREYYFGGCKVPNDHTVTPQELDQLLTSGFFDPHVTRLRNWEIAHNWIQKFPLENENEYDFGDEFTKNLPTDRLITSHDMDMMFTGYMICKNSN